MEERIGKERKMANRIHALYEIMQVHSIRNRGPNNRKFSVSLSDDFL